MSKTKNPQKITVVSEISEPLAVAVKNVPSESALHVSTAKNSALEVTPNQNATFVTRPKPSNTCVASTYEHFVGERVEVSEHRSHWEIILKGKKNIANGNNILQELGDDYVRIARKASEDRIFAILPLSKVTFVKGPPLF